MSFQDIQIPFLFGGANSLTSNVEQIQQSINNNISDTDIKKNTIINYYINHSYVILIMILCIVIMLYLNKYYQHVLIEYTPQILLYYISLFILSICGGLLFLGHGSNEDINNNF